MDSFNRMLQAAGTGCPTRAAMTAPRRAPASVGSYAHLRSAPRAALDRMAGPEKPADGWAAAHARVATEGASKPGADKDGWNASAKRVGVGQ